MKNNRWFIVLGAVVVVAGLVAFASWTGLYPPKNGTEGAIGAANRYQARQISADDVKVTESQVQAFLQSDLFHKIATNPRFRNALQEGLEDLAKSTRLNNEAALEALRSPRVRLFLNNDEYVETLKKAKEFKSFEDFAKRGIYKNPKIVQLISSDWFYDLAKDPKAQALVMQIEDAAAKVKFRNSDEWNEVMKTHRALQNEANADLFFDFAAAQELADVSQEELADWAESLKGARTRELLNDEGFQELMNSEETLNIATDMELAEEFTVLVECAKNPNLLAALEDPTVMEALNSPEIQELAKQGKLANLVADIDQ